MQGYRRIVIDWPQYDGWVAFVCPRARVVIINRAAREDANLIQIRYDVD